MGQLGIGDLDFYNMQFDASLKHADVKPQDPMMTMGLHTVVNFFMDNAISIANDPIEEINQDSTYFHRIYKYANGELQSGQEIAGGLFKSILIYQHDALTSMDNNTTITIVAFVVIMLVVMLQLAFLSQRIGSVVVNFHGITAIVQRILAEIEELSMELHADDNTLAAKKDTDVDADADDDSAEDEVSSIE